MEVTQLWVLIFCDLSVLYVNKVQDLLTNVEEETYLTFHCVFQLISQLWSFLCVALCGTMKKSPRAAIKLGINKLWKVFQFFPKNIFTVIKSVWTDRP